MPVEEDALHYLEANHRPTYVSSPEAEERRLLNEQIGETLLQAAPKSSGIRLPVKMADTTPAKKQPPRLLHPLLLKVPMHFRFGINGFICNVGFMVAYNMAVVQFQGQAEASTIYSVVYLIFIPVGHALISLIVFGWPEKYLPSLMSNAPIGLTAIALGATLTAYLDRVSFNTLVVDLIAKGWSSMGYETEPKPADEKGEFYSSLLVLLITGVWTFVLSVFINAPSEKSEKKEN
jgi:hypothetical protein